MADKRRHQLPSAAWVNGGNIQVPLKGIPKGARIAALRFRLEGVFTTGAAAAIVAGSQLHRLISMIDVGPQRRGSGQFWAVLARHMRLMADMPASIPAVNASVYRRYLTWLVPFYDPRGYSPGDGLPSGGDFNDVTVSIDTAAFAGLGAGTWDTLASITGTLRAEAVLADPNDAPGAFIEYGVADLTGQTPVLPPGLYRDLFLFRENGAVITSVQVATIALQADGRQIHDVTRLSEYARAWNEAYGQGSEVEADSATAPVLGERLQDAPDVAAGAADTVTMPYTPILIPEPGYKLTKLVPAYQSLQGDFTGTDTTFHVGFARYRARSESEAVAAFHAIGRLDVTSGNQILPKTESKKSLTGVKAGLARFFPLRAVRSR